jgi:two-component system NtrC family sensor kinase
MISLYGYSKEELIGRDLLLFMDVQNYEALYRAFTTNYEGSPFILLRQEHRRKDGSAVPVSCRGRIIEMNGRNHLFCSIRDCTERIRQEQESALLQAQFMQTEKMASVGVLAAGIAHEINNPMAFISSNLSTMDKYLRQILPYIDFLADKALRGGDAGVAGEIDRMRRQLNIEYMLQDAVDLVAESASGAERVKKIVQDLKLFTRADDSEAKLFDVHECMENTINIVWNELKYKTTLDRDYGDIPLILGHPQQLSQVFMNLLINAAHAIDKEGRITIRTWREGTCVCISVADTGCGIPQENLNKIFEPFFTTKEVGKGSGLGLSIAYDIVTKKHSGKLSVASRPGDGTTFTVRLPVQ